MINDFQDAVKTLKAEHGFPITYIRRLSGTLNIQTGKVVPVETRFDIKRAVRADSNQLLAQFPSSLNTSTQFGGILVATVIKYIIDYDDIKNYIPFPSATTDYIEDDEFYKIVGINRLSDKAGYILSCKLDPSNE